MGHAAGTRAPPWGISAWRQSKLGTILAAAILLVCPARSAEDGFDCAAGYSDRAKTWTEEKRGWCCFHKSIACSGGAGRADANASSSTRGAAAADASAATSGQNSSGLHRKVSDRRGQPEAGSQRAHDCETGYARWREDWSE